MYVVSLIITHQSPSLSSLSSLSVFQYILLPFQHLISLCVCVCLLSLEELQNQQTESRVSRSNNICGFFKHKKATTTTAIITKKRSYFLIVTAAPRISIYMRKCVCIRVFFFCLWIVCISLTRLMFVYSCLIVVVVLCFNFTLQ